MAERIQWVILRRGVELGYRLDAVGLTVDGLAEVVPLTAVQINKVIRGEARVKAFVAEAILAAISPRLEFDRFFESVSRTSKGLDLIPQARRTMPVGPREIDPTGRGSILAGRGTQ
ncbi:hypothetical protein [Kineosporia sp. NBRC 101731]|uniref:hypothetical protein n=1 Tax=Kineosporia sp. NBRC 101731 TaxID=3032199 RepID=UPI0025564FE2|nr:hypothetical protein [Kineosporia sp. NBRC 101731]